MRMRLAAITLTLALLGFTGCGLVRAIVGGGADGVTETDTNKPAPDSPWFYLLAYAVSREAAGTGVNLLRSKMQRKG